MKMTLELSDYAVERLLKRVAESERGAFVSEAILAEFDRCDYERLQDEQRLGGREAQERDYCEVTALLEAELADSDFMKNTISLAESNRQAEKTLASLRTVR